MASDVSSGCNEAFMKLDEKEEGEISLEDVSSSEEGQSTYGYENRTPQCPHCLSTQHCATWCTGSTRSFSHRSQSRRDAVQGKENRRYTKDYSSTGTKHTNTTLQEKNDDLLPISSDSDMELVGLADNSKQILLRTGLKSKVKKKRKKKKGGHGPAFTMDDLISPMTNEIAEYEIAVLKNDTAPTKTNHSSRSHHRETSSVHKSSRSRVLSRSPPRRHRSPPISVQLPVKKIHSPTIHSKPPLSRRSPRRHRSPRRSPYRSPVRTDRDISKLDSSQVSRTYFDIYEDAKLRAKLLRKVKELDSLGADSVETSLEKNKERASSLKEKLSNMMKITMENDENVIHYPKERSDLSGRKLKEPDDEEDLALLRQKALETKKKLMTHSEQFKENHDTKEMPHNDEEHDEEELRMIALRSAVLKKHQNRIQRGLKLGMPKKYVDSRSESPFGQSFLENIQGEDSSDFQSPHTSPGLNESMHTEDMDLDTDIEREKEKLPYSPTDNITLDIPIDTEMLGIQPSDVSFITVNEANNCTYNNMATREGNDDLHTRIVENKSYLSGMPLYMSIRNAEALTNRNIPYPLPNPTETSNQLSNIPIPTVTDTLCNTPTNIQIRNNLCLNMHGMSMQERPYSPTDIPVYDPDLSQSLPQLDYSNSFTPIHNSSMHLATPNTNSVRNNIEEKRHLLSHLNLELPKGQSNITESENPKQLENISVCTNIGLSSSSKTQLSSNSTITKIDELPHIDANSHNVIVSTSSAQNTVVFPPNDLSLNETIQESSNIQTTALNATKDAQKIPTLINRKLMSASSISKLNKQLQKSSQIRKHEKHEIHAESTFKTTEIQSESEVSNKSSTPFNPVQSVSQKKSVTSDNVNKHARHDSMKTNSSSKDKNRNNHSGDTNKTTNINDTSKDSVSNTRKRNVRKNSKHRSSSETKSNVNKTIDIPSVYIKDDEKYKNKNSESSEKNISKLDVNKSIVKHDNKITKTQEDSSVSTCTSDSIKESVNVVPIKDTTNKKRKLDDLINEPYEGTIQSKENENRRESVDDDEETLRATLLASLAKRSKPSDGNVCITTTVTTSNIKAEDISRRSNGHTTTTATKQQMLNNNTATVIPEKRSMSSQSTLNTNSNTNTKVIVTSNVTNKSLSHLDNENMITSSNSLKKKSPTVIKGPPKKITKKVSIPASTKVVNNAKKYQNTIVQRKLYLQKAATLHNVQKQPDNKFVTNLRNNENKWTATAKPSVLTDTQRIVISLGSDTDSDDSETEHQKTTDIIPNSITSPKHPTLPIPMKEFEKNLEKLLRDERKKQESAAAAANSTPTTSTKSNISQTRDTANLDTPLAVRRHLPASKQEEYRRLKQQIIEREKLRRPTQNNAAAQYAKKQSSQIPLNTQNKEMSNQSFSVKNQNSNIHSPIVKDTVKNASSVDVHNTQDSSNKFPAVPKVTKHVNNTLLLQTNGTKKTMTNFSISVHNENATNQSNMQKILTNETTQKMTPDNSIKEIPKNPLPTIRVLSKDDLNEKYVQIQVNQETNGRVVIINNKEDCSNNNKDQPEEISENRNIVDKGTDKDTTDKENKNENDNAKLINNESSIIKSGSIMLQSPSDKDAPLLLTIDSSTSSRSNPIWDDRSNIEEIKAEVNTIFDLSQAEQQQHLRENENELVAKRYVVLEELMEMSGDLQQWDKERDLQMSLVAEVKKLRELLRIAEEKLQEQRNRISNIGPKVMAAHEKINDGCRECFKLSKLCSMLGGKLHGQNYKVPDAGSQLLHNKLKEVAARTRLLSQKRVPFIDIPDNTSTTSFTLQSFTIKTDNTSNEESTSSSRNDNAEDTNETDPREDQYLTESLESKDNIDLSLFTATPRNIVSLEEECEETDDSAKNQNIEQNIPARDDLANNERQSCNNTITPATSKPNAVLNEQSSPVSLSQEDTPIKEVKNETREEVQETSKSDDVASKSNAEMSQQDFEFASKKTIEPYISILSHLKEPRNTNPNGVLCPYELMGTCCDAECQFVHQSNHTQ